VVVRGRARRRGAVGAPPAPAGIVPAVAIAERVRGRVGCPPWSWWARSPSSPRRSGGSSGAAIGCGRRRERRPGGRPLGRLRARGRGGGAAGHHRPLPETRRSSRRSTPSTTTAWSLLTSVTASCALFFGAGRPRARRAPLSAQAAVVRSAPPPRNSAAFGARADVVPSASWPGASLRPRPAAGVVSPRGPPELPPRPHHRLEARGARSTRWASARRCRAGRRTPGGAPRPTTSRSPPPRPSAASWICDAPERAAVASGPRVIHRPHHQRPPARRADGSAQASATVPGLVEGCWRTPAVSARHPVVAFSRTSARARMRRGLHAVVARACPGADRIDWPTTSRRATS
jgi:hypothetical protein